MHNYIYICFVFDVSCPPCQHLPVKRLAKRLASDLKRTF